MPLARLIGNALLIAAYEDDYTSKGVLEGGTILQSLGYAFLFSASLAFYMRATRAEDAVDSSVGLLSIRSLLRSGRRNSSAPEMRQLLPQAMHLVNTLALVLLLVGYIKSDNVFTASDTGNATLSPLVKAGDLLFLLLTVVLAALTVAGLVQRSNWHDDTSTLLIAILLSLPFLLIRAVFVTQEVFATDGLHGQLVLRAVLQYASEAVVIVVYTVMGLLLLLLRKRSSEDVELASTEQKAQSMR